MSTSRYGPMEIGGMRSRIRILGIIVSLGVPWAATRSSEPAPVTNSGESQLRVLRQLEAGLGVEAIRPHWADWAVSQRKMTSEEQGARNIYIRRDEVVRSVEYLSRRLLEAKVILVGDYHICSGPKEECIRLMERHLVGASAKVHLGLECLPSSAAQSLTSIWEAGSPGALSAALSILRQYWPYPLRSYQRLLEFAWQHHVSIHPLGPGELLPAYISELPDAKRVGLVPAESVHAGLAADLEENMSTLAASLAAGAPNCTVLFCGNQHVLTYDRRSDRSDEVVGIVPFDPRWQYAALTRGWASQCVEALSGTFTVSSTSPEIEVNLSFMPEYAQPKLLSAEAIGDLLQIIKVGSRAEGEHLASILLGGAIPDNVAREIGSKLAESSSEFVRGIGIKFIQFQDWNSEAAAGFLWAVLRHNSKWTRDLAFRRLARLGSTITGFRREALRVASATDEPGEVRRGAAFAVGSELASPEVVLPLLMDAVADDDIDVVGALGLIRAYGKLSAAWIPRLQKLLLSTNNRAREALAWTIREILAETAEK